MLRIEHEDTVDGDDMKVDVVVQGRPEPMNEGNGPGTCLRLRAASTAQAVLDGVENDAQGAAERLRVTLQVIAQPPGER